MSRKRSRAELAALVKSEAYALLADGRNPTVRAVRETVRASTNEVAAALADWRRNLKARLDESTQELGLPAHVAEYVRVGIRAAESLRIGAERAGAEPVAGVLEQRNAALESAIRLVERDRDELRELTGRLQADLTIARRLAADREAARTALTTAVGTADALRVELSEARTRAAHVKVLEQQLDVVREALASAQAERAAARQTTDALRAALAEARTRAERTKVLDQQLEETREALAGARVELAAARETTAALRAGLEEARAGAARAAVLEQQLDEARAALSVARRKLAAAGAPRERRAVGKPVSRARSQRPPRSPNAQGRTGHRRAKAARVTAVTKRAARASRKPTRVAAPTPKAGRTSPAVRGTARRRLKSHGSKR